MKEIFRPEEYPHFPMIIKASTAGTLETLLKEVERLAQGYHRVHVIDYGVGPVSEADMHNSLKTGAVIFGFDVGCLPPVERRASPEGCCIRLHKLIYKFIDDVKNFAEESEMDAQL